MPRHRDVSLLAIIFCLAGAGGCALAPDATVGLSPAPPPDPVALVPIRALLTEALAKTEALPKPSPSARILEWLYASIAKAQARIGDVPEALQTLQRVPNPHVRANYFTDLLRILVRHGDLAGARQTAGDRDPARLALVGVLMDAGHVTEAQAVAATITDRVWRFHAHSIMARGFLAKGDHTAAAREVAGITEWLYRIQILDELLRAQLEAGDLAGALAIARRPTGEMDPSRLAQIAGHLAERQPAVSVLALVLRHTPRPAVSAGEAYWALALGKGDELEKVQAARRGLEEAQTQAERGDLAGALRTLGALPRDWDSMDLGWAVRRIAVGRARGGDEAEARSILEVIGWGERKDIDEAIVQGRLRRGDVPGALAMAEAIADAEVRDWGIGHVIRHLVRVGDIPGARALVFRMREGGRMASARWDAIAKVQLAAGDYAGAMETLGTLWGNEEGKQIIRQQQAMAMLKARDPDAALALARQIPKQFVSQLQPTLRAIAVAFTERGRTEDALALTDLQMPQSRLHTRQGVVRTLARLGQAEQARSLIDPRYPPHEQVLLLIGIADGLIDRLPGRQEAA